MDELTLFYYLCWLLYIVVYFFAPLKPMRNYLLMAILLFICFSPLQITVGSLIISISFIILLVSTVILFGTSIVRMYELLLIFICMITYAGLLIWEKIAPVFFFMPASIIVASFIVLLVCLLIKSFSLKVIIIIAGLTFGQLIYETLLYVYVKDALIGSYHYLNYLLITILLLTLMQYITRFITFVMTYPSYKYHY